MAEIFHLAMNKKKKSQRIRGDTRHIKERLAKPNTSVIHISGFFWTGISKSDSKTGEPLL